MIAEATVHTNGINWDSISLLVTSIVVAMVAVAGYVRTSIKNSRKAITDQIETSVKQMATILNIKFEDVTRRISDLEARERYRRR